ncbi:hypothetical protein [Clostridium saccharoperbutylacetonicum]
MSRRKNKIPKSDFEYDEGEVFGFTSDVPVTGKCISSFSFDDDSIIETTQSIPENKTTDNISVQSSEKNNIQLETSPTNIQSTSQDPIEVKNISTNSKDIFDNRRTPVANGAAPPIDGEAPTIKRSYTLRSSTIRKINELKSIHPDINVCVSSIVDIAISHYHNHILNEGGTQY